MTVDPLPPATFWGRILPQSGNDLPQMVTVAPPHPGQIRATSFWGRMLPQSGNNLPQKPRTLQGAC